MPADSASTRDPLDLVLHIGSGKTGTSSIQYFMNLNRAALADLGLLYPRTPGPRRHYRLSLFARSDGPLEDLPSWRRERERGRFSSPEAFRKTFRRRLLREIDESGLSRVLLSDEALYASSDEAMQRLSRFVHRIASSLRIVVYLRRQDDHLVSRYQQVVKHGETVRLAERTQQPNLSGTYDYYLRLRTWERLLKPSELVVRRFEPDGFVDGSLVQDFLDAANIDARADDFKQAEPVNESLDAEAVELLRILNMFRAEDAAAQALPATNNPLITRLAAASAGPTLTLSSPVLDEFMARWEQSNQDVARELLGDESGTLFHAPRRTHNTTTEQRLDPARLNQFLTLLELPEQVHAPLRALVEREAKSP